MEYKFVSEESGWKLEDAVTALLALGWVPIGGVSVAVMSTPCQKDRKGCEEVSAEWVYAQAMTRTDEQAKAAATLRDC